MPNFQTFKSNPKSSDYKAKFGGATKEQKKQSQEALRKAKIQEDFINAKRELEAFHPLFAAIDTSEYDEFLRNSCAAFYDQEIVIPPAFSSGKGSKKFQLLLIMMGLVMAANSVEEDEKAGTEDISTMFNKFSQDLSKAAQSSKEGIEQIVESSLEYYSTFSPAKPITKAAEYLVIPIVNAKAKGRSVQPVDFALPVLTDLVNDVAFVEAKKTTQNEIPREEFEAFWSAVYLGNLQQVTRTLDKMNRENKLESLLTMADKTNHLSAFYAACHLGNAEMAALMLEAAKNHPAILREMLTTGWGHDQSTVFFSVCYSGNTKIAGLILDAIADNSDLLTEILTKLQGYAKVSAFHVACESEKTEIVKIIIDRLGDKKSILDKLVNTVQGTYKRSIFYRTVELQKLEVAKIMVDKLKNKAVIFKKMLTTTFSAEKFTSFYMACISAKEEFTKIILDGVNDNPELAKSLMEQKPEGAHFISPINHLLLSGDFEAVKSFLKHNPIITREKLPVSYVSSAPQTSIYYLEAFLKGNPSNKAVYFQLQKGKLSEIAIDEISTVKNEPILIELKSADKIRKVILGSDISNELGLEKNSLDVKKAMKLAEKNNVNEIIFTLNMNSHSTNLKLFKNSNNEWEAEFHDSNKNANKKYTDFASELVKEVGIKKFTKINFIVPNYASQSTIIGGNCDMISAMVGASFLIGQDHVNGLRQRCSEIGENCVEILGKELNPKVDNILDQRLEYAKKLAAPDTSLSNPKLSGELKRETKEKEL